MILLLRSKKAIRSLQDDPLPQELSACPLALFDSAVDLRNVSPFADHLTDHLSFCSVLVNWSKGGSFVKSGRSVFALLGNGGRISRRCHRTFLH